MSIARFVDGVARYAAGALVARRAPGQVRRAFGQPIAAEPLETRTMLSTTVTLNATHKNGDTFLATLDSTGKNVQFYIDATPSTGSPAQTVPVSQLAGLSIVGGDGSQALTIDTPGATFTLDASQCESLTVTQQAGTVNLGRNAVIDDAEDGISSYSLLGGTLQVNETLTIGSSDYGTFTQSGGTLNTGELMVRANGGAGTVELTGGTLNVDTLSVGSGNKGSSGNVEVSGGSLSVNDDAMVGADGAEGEIDVSGTGQFADAGSLMLGAGSGDGSLNITDGSAAVGSGLILGTADDEGDIGSGEVTVSGGTLFSNANAYVGYSGDGTLSVSGTGTNGTKLSRNRPP